MPLLLKSRLTLRFLSFVLFAAFSAQGIGLKAASAAILFEGWSKVLISGKHVGYVIQRYEFDEKKKEFRAVHFLKTNPESGGLNESLVARSTSAFKPVAYQYTSLADGKATLIDATFKGDKMTALVTEGKEKKTVTNNLPKGAFLSTFLGYVMLQGKDGLKKGIKYEYDGILEEAAIVAKGTAYISEEEVVAGIPVFRILNTVNGGKFVNLATHKAEILGTISPSAGIQTELVATLEEAVAGFGVNTSALTKLFGSMPKGKENEIARRSAMPPPTQKAAPATQTPQVPSLAPKAPASPTTAPAAQVAPQASPPTPPVPPSTATPAAKGN